MKQTELHVIHIETGKELYGGALQVLYLLRGLKKSAPHIKNILLCPVGSAIERVARDSGIQCKAVPYAGELDLRLFIRLALEALAIKKRGKTLLIHVHSRRGADLWGPLAGLATHTPYIITRRVDNPEPTALLHMKYKKALKVVTISRAIREILMGYGVKSERIVVIPSGVDTTQYRPGCKDSTWFKQEFNLNDGAKAVGMVAQFIPRKGHHFLIRAIPSISREVPNAVFLFFGKGPLKGEAEYLAKRLGVYEACRFVGFRGDMARIFPCLDLLVHPALMEGLGVSVLQAMACGVPVVATQNGGLMDVVRHQETAIALVGPDLSEELKKKIPYLLKNESIDLRNRMVDKALRLIHEDFSMDSMTTKYLHLYEGIGNL